MRLRSIRLSWFRGAAAEVTLDLAGRSAVVFGSNGAGKSALVDGVEATLSGGKVGHLGHEYSGRNQEKGLINTARPVGAVTEVEVTLADGSSERLTWRNAAPIRTESSSTATSRWDYRRISLRQEELSRFITATKGEKYNALLPLLGLSQLEQVCDNLHKLAKTIERRSEVQNLQTQVDLAAARRQEAFADRTDDQLWERLEQLRAFYVPGEPVESKAATVVLVSQAIDKQIKSLDAEKRRAAAVGEVSVSNLSMLLGRVSEIAAEIAEVAEPLIKERLDVLGAADAFASSGDGGSETIQCPACGQSVGADQFKAHVAAERERLGAVEKLYEGHRAAVSVVCNEVLRLRTIVQKNDLSGWRSDLPADLQKSIAYLEKLSLDGLRAACTAAHVAELAAKLEPLIQRASNDAKQLPPEVQTLMDDHAAARALDGTLKAVVTKANIGRAQALINLTLNLEEGVLEEIAERARVTLANISADVQRYWKVLLPSEAITDVKLVVPEENDKAIEVALCFHGKTQASPLLTLSEGKRNALGLCIFLSMANKASGEDHPVILDDVVISFDREHRSRVATLLTQGFSDRQILILTHDREWFFELQRMLPQPKWKFSRLRPWLTPLDGIAFADEALERDVARARAKSDPIEGMAFVRRIMDVALSEIAEKVRLPVPHMRGDDNDHRTSGQFLVALERVGAKAFHKKEGDAYVAYTDAIHAIRKTKPELAVWGNRSTHTFSGSTAEAADLIDGCEAVLKAFICDACNTSVGTVEASGGKIECRCGALQWRLG
jgi:hypothetical protein